MPVTGGKYLEASPPNTVLIRNEVKEKPGKKTSNKRIATVEAESIGICRWRRRAGAVCLL